MLKEPLFRLGVVILAVSLALMLLPFYDRGSLFAVVNLIVFLAGLGIAFGGAVRMDRRGG